MIALLTFAGLLLFATLVALGALLAAWADRHRDEHPDPEERRSWWD